MAVTKKNTAAVVAEKIAATGAVAPVAEEKPAKVYKADSFIPCRSLTRGELIYVSKKTDNTYRWNDFGDVTEVEYQDLMGLRASNSGFLFKPLFVIEDEELLADARWKDVEALYEKIQANDVETVLNLPSDRFDSVFAGLPIGVQNAVKSEIATRMEAGTFDSIQKIKTVDRVCGTDLICLL